MKSKALMPSLFCALILAVEPCVASEAVSVGMKSSIWRQELPEMGTITTGVLTIGQKSFLFMPPVGWQVEPDQGGVVRLVGAERSLITIRLLRDTSVKEGAPAIEKLRQQAQSRVPGAKIFRETVCHTEAESGPAFDLEWRDAQGIAFGGRVVFVRVGEESFELSLITLSERFNGELTAFAGFLTSFQVAVSSAGS